MSVYHLAFRHRSAASEHQSGIKLSNERLEYLGDAVLGAVIAELLFKKYPFRDVGFLTEMRSKIVNRELLGKLAMKLGIDQFMVKSIDPAAKNRSAYGDAFEALIGAVYIDKGYDATRKLIINRFVKHHIDLEEIENQDTNFKSILLEYVQAQGNYTPRYMVVDEIGPDHDKQFTLAVYVGDECLGIGVGKNKKEAEQAAALHALRGLSRGE